MLLLLVVSLELLFLYYWITSYAVVLLLFIYAVSYMDGSEYRGNRTWNDFRRLRLWSWRSPVQCVIPPNFQHDAAARLFVVLPSDTYVALFWGFGLHGGALSPLMSERLFYVVPPIYMWVPLVRDVLMWSGAITYGRKQSLTSVLQEAIVKNTSSVAFYASLTSSNYTPPNEVETQAISNDILEFVHQRDMLLCVVVVCKEHKRYWIANHNVLGMQAIQRWCWERYRHPFPLIWFKRGYCARKPPPKVVVQFGPMIPCGRQFQATIDDLKTSFTLLVHSLCVAELDDKVIRVH